jgi:transposase
MPKAFPPEFRRDVVAVARKREAPISQIAKDFGISEACLHRWLKLADIEDGVRPGVTASDNAELRELKKRNRTLEQENEFAAYRPKARAARRHPSRPSRSPRLCVPRRKVAGEEEIQVLERCHVVVSTVCVESLARPGCRGVQLRKRVCPTGIA